MLQGESAAVAFSATGEAGSVILTPDSFVLSALNWSYQWLRPEGRLPLEVLAQRYGDMILHALGSAADDTAQEGRQHAA